MSCSARASPRARSISRARGSRGGARRARAAQRRALPRGEGPRLHRRRHRGLQRALPARGARPRDPARRALRHRALDPVPRPRPLQAGERHATAIWSARTRCASSRGCSRGACGRWTRVARYGGDEFTILLVDTGERVGRTVAERIRRSRSSADAFEAGDGTDAAPHLQRWACATYPRTAARARRCSTPPTRPCTAPSRWAGTACAARTSWTSPASAC